MRIRKLLLMVAVSGLLGVSYDLAARAADDDGSSEGRSAWAGPAQRRYIPAQSEAAPRPKAKPAPARRPAEPVKPTNPNKQVAYDEPIPESDPGYDEPMAGPGDSFAPDGDCCNWNSCSCMPPVWGRAEYLLWWTKGMTVPALVTTSTTTTQTGAGALGTAGASVLFGDGNLKSSSRSGGRIDAGWWLDECRTTALDVTYTFLGDQDNTYSTNNTINPIIARPFFNTQTGAQDARLVAFPLTIAGNVNIDTSSSLDTVEILIRHIAVRDCDTRLDYFVGYRFAELDDRLHISDSSLALSGVAVGSTISTRDFFNTKNTFNGGEIGAVYQWQHNCRWSWEVMTKVALGNTNSQTTISGQTTSTVAGGTTATRQGGLLTQNSNIGTFDDNKFSAIGELGVTLRRSFTCNLTGTFGYRLFAWSDVMRAGDQIDTSVDTRQFNSTTPIANARPIAPQKSSDYWAQGLHLGLEYAF